MKDTDPSIVYVSHDGVVTPGRFVWTPGSEPISDDDLVYAPDATEFIPAPDEAVDEEAKKQLSCDDGCEPVYGDDDNLEVVAASLSQVCRYYRGRCAGNDPYPNNCAHYLSDAFIRAGYTDLLTSNLITARCRSGKKRPIRAYDMYKWFRSKARRTRRGVIPRGNGIWATYQEKPGAKHVLISNTDDWTYCGTGDYPSWPTQINFQW